MAKLAGGSFMAVRFKREEKDLKKRMTREVKMTLIAILRRSSIVDTMLIRLTHTSAETH